MFEKQKSFELHQASRLCFYHEVIVDRSFAVHTGLTVCLHSKQSSKSHQKVYIFSPKQSKVESCLSAAKHWFAYTSVCLQHYGL